MYFKSRHIKAVLFAKCGFVVVKDLLTTMQRFHFVHIRVKKWIKPREEGL